MAWTLHLMYVIRTIPLAALCHTGINSQKVSTKHENFNQSQTSNAWMGQVLLNASTGSHTPSWQLDDTWNRNLLSNFMCGPSVRSQSGDWEFPSLWNFRKIKGTVFKNRLDLRYYHIKKWTSWLWWSSWNTRAELADYLNGQGAKWFLLQTLGARTNIVTRTIGRKIVKNVLCWTSSPIPAVCLITTGWKLDLVKTMNGPSSSRHDRVVHMSAGSTSILFTAKKSPSFPRQRMCWGMRSRNSIFRHIHLHIYTHTYIMVQSFAMASYVGG